MHAYPLQPREGREDGGFEIEIILRQKPKSNVFAFTIEDAQDLDFFDQPKPSAEKIPEGTVRPESVISSSALYHKTKANHRVGDTIYASGKACRPHEVPIGEMKFGQSSLWQGLVAHLRTSRIARKRRLPVAVADEEAEALGGRSQDKETRLIVR